MHIQGVQKLVSLVGQQIFSFDVTVLNYVINGAPQFF